MMHSSHVTYLGHLSFPPSIISEHINCAVYQSPLVSLSVKEDSWKKEFIKLLKCFIFYALNGHLQ